TDVEEASVKEANVEEVDVATDEFDRDDESEALSSENSGGKKRDRDGDALYHSTSKWRLIDPECDCECGGSVVFVPPLIKFSPGAPVSKSMTSALENHQR
ncbi:16152_t:CDS:2, partial [Gigaspora rosea]